jgi:hypothetical protein
VFKDKIEQGWVNSCALIKVRSFCCARGTHGVTVQRQDWTRLSELNSCAALSLVQSCRWTLTRCVPLVQQKLLTLIRAHEFTQPCSILSLNSDTMGAPSAAETSYLTFIGAHEFTQPWSILSLNSDTMCAPNTAETSYLYHSTCVQFTQPCSILSLNSDAMCALVQQTLLTLNRVTVQRQDWSRLSELMCSDKGKVRSFCCTRGTHRVTVQRQDWTRLGELMCCDKGKKCLLP